VTTPSVISAQAEWKWLVVPGQFGFADQGPLLWRIDLMKRMLASTLQAL